MKIKPIALNDTSFDVSLLHQALAVLGMPVSAQEAAARHAGADTQKRVRTLQKQLKLPVDEAMLADRDTLAAIVSTLKQRGLADAGRSFIVSGKVRTLEGGLGAGHRLLAFDLDLRGVAAYRQAGSLEELEKAGGIEFLGETNADADGAYSLGFHEWQYARAERGKADVVVFAVDGDKRIVGRSSIASAAAYDATGLVRDHDVTLDAVDGRSEYALLMEALLPFLEESEVGFERFSTSREQIEFTASELGLRKAHLALAADAQNLIGGRSKYLLHELLYGLGRQKIRLQWSVLYGISAETLRDAIDASVQARIIDAHDEARIKRFLAELRQRAAQSRIDPERSQGAEALDALLGNALPEQGQRQAFLAAYSDYQGDDYTEFWRKHLPSQPEFSKQPELLDKLLTTQQLSALTGDFPALVAELQSNRGISSAEELLDLDKKDWLGILEKTGLPDFVEDDGDANRAEAYATHLTDTLNAAFPTRRIARMIESRQLPVADTAVSKGLSKFLSSNRHFDFAVSRVQDFDETLRAATGKHFAGAKRELLKLQRVFQVSPNPTAMGALVERGLDSARAIAGIPAEAFVEAYADALGGADVALTVHQRSMHMSTRTEMAAMHMLEYSHGANPESAMGKPAWTQALALLQKHVPNYSELFGGPDLCECEHCRSVHSAAAYFVDLLRFLWRSKPNDDGKTPLDVLKSRRPDLLHLPLTCENTNTVLPYVDLANEVMEHYTDRRSLAGFEGHDTGAASVEELRANPQHFNLEAYRTLDAARYPFTLPYHQPLDVIRSYGDHLGIGRDETMRAANPIADAATAAAIAAESLRLSESAYIALTGHAFDGTPDPTGVHVYYGYTAAGDIEQASAVPEFLRRSGIAYTELVELVASRFVNPHQDTLDFLQKIFAAAGSDTATIYAKLKQIRAGTLTTAADTVVATALAAYNTRFGAAIAPAAFDQWIATHFDAFLGVLTLYQPESSCDLDTTRLRTIGSIYENRADSGIGAQGWSRLHRLIRLWRRLGWSLHDTDLVLSALAENDITPALIGKLEAVAALKQATGLTPAQLGVLWGDIDTAGDHALYRKLFLNKAMQRIDPAFAPNAWGQLLADPSRKIGQHRSTLLAAFRINDEDFNAILRVARIKDGAVRALDPATDPLTLANVSTLYRYVVLADALKLRVAQFCRLVTIFGAVPFSIHDRATNAYTGIAPAATLAFHRIAGATKTRGFSAAALDYILHGTLDAQSSLGLERGKALAALRQIRESFAAIEQEHPDTAPQPLSPLALAAKLALTFQPDTLARLIDLLQGQAAFETVTDANLALVIPEALAVSYRYTISSGRLTSGVMSDADRVALKALAGATPAFRAAVDRLYEAPTAFLATHFAGIFDDLGDAAKTLLDRPAQAPAATLEARLAYVHAHFVPVLKRKLRRDAITQGTAALIGLDTATAALLIDQDLDALTGDILTPGFSTQYFSDAAWGASALRRTDSGIGFDWGSGAPDPSLPADGFSARWQAHLVAPVSGEYTLVVDVADPGDAFNLYLDDTLILRKNAADATTVWEVVADLNASRMHRLRLDYAHVANAAAVRLRWKTATTALDAIPASAAYPADAVDRVLALLDVRHRAAGFIRGFGLDAAEVGHLAAHAADFDDIDFKALSAVHWRRIHDYASLRESVPQALARLIDVFAKAATSAPAPSVAELKTLLQRATAWDRAGLDALVDTHFALTAADFRNEIALNRLREMMRIAARTGLSAHAVADWGSVETDFDALHAAAQRMKNAVKAKYGDADWLQVAAGLSNPIRERQQQALIAHLLTRQEIIDWGARDADGLFEYFLIDVQMTAPMETSRIVQANCSVQLFVSRCLLNLESDVTANREHGVPPAAIDRDRWEWMKHYRVWEANRKVFLYPENWLEPEWRNDRSEFFRELESYLVQNDITDRSVEQAFRNYLTSLNEVANLDVCGSCRENHDDGSFKCLHVFARSHNAPYRYYYRRWNQHRKWSAWQRVAVDVRNVEDGESPANNGAGLSPVVWKQRLFLFWPEYQHVHAGMGSLGQNTPRGAADTKISAMQPDKITEMRLGWSEYVDGKWTPRQVSKEYLRLWPTAGIAEKDYLLSPRVVQATQALEILVTDTVWNLQAGTFTLADIQSPVVTYDTMRAALMGTPVYRYGFMRRVATRQLELKGDVYLKTVVPHRLLAVASMKGSDIELNDPFFYSDARHTYFVRPVPITVYDQVRRPEKYKPRLPKIPEIIDERRRPPIKIPIPRPDDYLPNELRDPSISMLRPISYELELKVGAKGLTSLAINGIKQPAAMATRTLQLKRADIGTTVKVGQATVHTKEGPYKINGNRIGLAFSGHSTGIYYHGSGFSFIGRVDSGLEFHTFHHPHSSRFVGYMNRGGVAELLRADTAIASDEGSAFAAYQPNFSHGFVQKPADFPARTYYKENICFDAYGANSLYNWELFFHAPLYIATRLSRNGKHEEAMRWFHHIFDPTSNAVPQAGQSPASRYWNVLPFKTAPVDDLEAWFRSLSPNGNPDIENAVIAEWRDHPFDPYVMAANRPLAFMKNVVNKYVENLIAWGDSLFRQDSMESVNEAIQLYVLAAHVLGPRPQFVPKRGEIAAESYDSLSAKWDDFSNALVELENLFPYSGSATASSSASAPSLLGIGPALYFCIPPNEKLMQHWDTVADRLFKIRHCQNIDGVERKLALFAPPIDPAALIKATSQGLSLASILSDLSSPPPIYRFTYLIQKANEFCADVKALGQLLLSALEKKDGETLARLRASHETQLLEAIASIRERALLDAQANRQILLKTRDIARFRIDHYNALLGNANLLISDPATIGADGALPADTSIITLVPDVDEALKDSGERGVKLIPKEKEALDKNEAAKWTTFGAGAADTLAGIFNLFPQLDAEGTPFGVGAGAWWGGQNLGAGTSALARAASTAAEFLSHEATQAATMAGYIRREQDWTLQVNLAAKEIVQIDKQIASADIRIQIAQKELENHRKQIEDARTVELFLGDKFSNEELYQWMKEQLFSLHKQSFNLSFDMAKKAEKAYRYEIGTDLSSFIQYGYWDDAKQGLAAGDKLQLALRQMEKSYLEQNRRELELTKHISLSRLDPLALIELRETGKCSFLVPEELFDLDHRGHFFRRIKGVALSLPCIAGPYTSIGCSLRLLSNAYRANTLLNAAGGYEHENDEGVWIDDDRFRSSQVPVTAIATSQAQNDPGLFEFHFRDERYLPFEGAGAISGWQIELSTDRDLRQFDYSTISDAVLHLSYTTREGGGLFKDKATAYLKQFLGNAADHARQPLAQMYSLRHEFPGEWHRCLYPAIEGAEQSLSIALGKDRFPYFVQQREIDVSRIDLFARFGDPGDYHVVLAYENDDGDEIVSTPVVMSASAAFGGLHRTTLNAADAGMNLDEWNMEVPLKLKFKRSTAADYTRLQVTPTEELRDAYLILGYRLR